LDSDKRTVEIDWKPRVFAHLLCEGAKVDADYPFAGWFLLAKGTCMLRESAPTVSLLLESRSVSQRAYRIHEAAAVLGISKRTVWRLIENGTLVSSKFLRTRLVTGESLARYGSTCRELVPLATDDRPSLPTAGAPPSRDRTAYSVDEVAALLRVTRRTVQRAVADGRLKSSKERGARLIDADGVLALLLGLNVENC
jgi:excisionase family DNA binding protein